MVCQFMKQTKENNDLYGAIKGLSPKGHTKKIIMHPS